jgi:hypothetical protein
MNKEPIHILSLGAVGIVLWPVVSLFDFVLDIFKRFARLLAQ